LERQADQMNVEQSDDGGEKLDWLRSRRSVRRFQPHPVPDGLVRIVLETATWAPSAHNRQPWRFAVLKSPQARQNLADAMGEAFQRDLLADGLSPQQVQAQVSRSRARINEAPVAVVLCLDPSQGDVYPDPFRLQAELMMGVQGVALAGGYLLLAAHAVGLAGVWVCAPLFTPAVVRRALHLPDEWQPQALILLGYPESIPKPRPRRPLDEVAIFQ
jgi:coenzyme F420-0:L-glutamate ligase/coenzyme F420-1:gamma-L-glutamate ligase